MKIDKESNNFILIFMILMGLLVSVFLTAAYSLLKPFYLNNIKKERAAYIMRAIGIPATFDNALELFQKHFVKADAFDINGNPINIQEHYKDPLIDYNPVDEMKNKPLEQRFFFIYQCVNDKDTFYVFPVAGRGLWGPVWAYVGIKNDFKTIKYIVFDHEGETPGLGAEIATDAFSKQFVDKPLWEPSSNKFIRVLKFQDYRGEPFTFQGLSGATFTTNGVNNMLKTYLPVYWKIISKNYLRQAPS